MKNNIILYASSFLSLVETTVICINLYLAYTLPIEVIVFIMAIGSGLLLFSSNLCNMFYRIEKKLPSSKVKEINLHSIMFCQLHDLFLLQSIVAAVSFLYLHIPKWILLPFIKEILLWAVQIRLGKK